MLELVNITNQIISYCVLVKIRLLPFHLPFISPAVLINYQIY